MIIALTGHRSEDCRSEEDVRRRLSQTLRSIPDESPVDAIICGMANGFDLWAGTEAIRLGYKVWAAKPWTNHGPRKSDVELYAEVIENASKIAVCTEVDNYPGPWVYHARNEWMVAHADRVLAYWSGKEAGGTYACIQYARKVGKPIRNIYE
jgi:uncharacterized phage-like protein YoqJ